MADWKDPPPVGDFVILRGDASEPFTLACVTGLNLQQKDQELSVRWWGTTNKRPLTARWLPGWLDPDDSVHPVAYRESAKEGWQEWTGTAPLESVMARDFILHKGRLPDGVRKIVEESVRK